MTDTSTEYDNLPRSAKNPLAEFAFELDSYLSDKEGVLIAPRNNIYIACNTLLPKVFAGHEPPTLSTEAKTEIFNTIFEQLQHNDIQASSPEMAAILTAFHSLATQDSGNIWPAKSAEVTHNLQAALKEFSAPFYKPEYITPDLAAFQQCPQIKQLREQALKAEEQRDEAALSEQESSTSPSPQPQNQNTVTKPEDKAFYNFNEAGRFLIHYGAEKVDGHNYTADHFEKFAEGLVHFSQVVGPQMHAQNLHFSKSALERSVHEATSLMKRYGLHNSKNGSVEFLGAAIAMGGAIETALDAQKNPLPENKRQQLHQTLLNNTKQYLSPQAYQAFEQGYQEMIGHIQTKKDQKVDATTFTRVASVGIGATLGAWALNLILGKERYNEKTGKYERKASVLGRVFGFALAGVAILGVAKIAVQGRAPAEALDDVTNWVGRTANQVTSGFSRSPR